MPACSFCNCRGHNIRSCPDGRITEAFVSLITDFVVPNIGSELSDEDYHRLWNRLYYIYPRILLRAMGVKYCRNRVNDTHGQQLVDRIVTELAVVSRYGIDGRDEWCIAYTGMTYTEYREHLLVDEYENENEVSYYVDRTPTEVAVDLAYPDFNIVLHLENETENSSTETCLECAICQEEITSETCSKVQCGHSYCYLCIGKYMHSKGTTRAGCPLCRAPIHSVETNDYDNYKKLNCYFSRTGALLKDCCKMAFDDEGLHCRSIDETIGMFLYEYEAHPGLINRVNRATSNEEKAEHLWRFIRACKYVE